MAATIIRGLTVASAFALFATTALAEEVTGIWNATVEGDMGPVELTFVFHQEGEFVTGSVSVGTTEAAIINGRISDNELTFSLPWGGEPGDMPQLVIDYRADISGDEMEIVSAFTGGDGEPVVTEFKARRAR
jgi:hypothetical protein